MEIDIRSFLTDVEYERIDEYPYLVLRYAEAGEESGPTLPCPFCGVSHRHGGTGHRIPHCQDLYIGRRGGKRYQPKDHVIAMDGQPLYRKSGYILKPGI